MTHMLIKNIVSVVNTDNILALQNNFTNNNWLSVAQLTKLIIYSDVKSKEQMIFQISLNDICVYKKNVLSTAID